jgi:hypothetical protein
MLSGIRHGRRPQPLPPPAQPPAAPILSKSLYAAYRGISPGRVSQLIGQGRIPVRAEDGQIDVAAADAMLSGELAEIAAEEALPRDPSLMSTKERRDRANADMAEVERDLLIGKAIYRDPAEREVEELFRNTREKILQVPREVAGDLARLGDEGAIAAHLLIALRKVLDGQYEEFRLPTA